MKLVTADNASEPTRPDPALIKSIARSHHLCFGDLATGRRCIAAGHS
jgi:hypothetical protein